MLYSIFYLYIARDGCCKGTGEPPAIIADVLPYGNVNVIVRKGGIDIPIPEEKGKTI